MGFLDDVQWMFRERFVSTSNVFQENKAYLKLDKTGVSLVAYEFKVESENLFSTILSQKTKFPDVIVFVECKKKAYVVIFELKSDNQSDAKIQCYCGQKFVEFIMTSLRAQKGKSYSPVYRKIALVSDKSKTKNKGLEFDHYGFAIHSNIAKKFKVVACLEDITK